MPSELQDSLYIQALPCVRYSAAQAQQDAEAAAEAAAADRDSTVKLSVGQLQRLKERNHMFMQRRTEAVFAKQREQEEHAARLEALQDQVCIKGKSRMLCSLRTNRLKVCIYSVEKSACQQIRGCSSYGRALTLHVRGTGIDALLLHCSLSILGFSFYAFVGFSFYAFVGKKFA